MTTTLATVPRKPTGAVRSHAWNDGETVSYYLRVPYQGDRVQISLGTNHEGWSEQRAQVELDRVMEQVKRGTWRPPRPVVERTDHGEALTATAFRWWQRRKEELSENTQADYKWRLGFVLEDLGSAATQDLDVRRVDEFRQWLVGKGLSPRSVNMVLDLLAQVLDDAVEYKLLDHNPARGKRRRMKVAKTRRSFLEPDMVLDLLDTAGEWERELPEHQRYGRRAFLTVLCCAGPRISELTQATLARLDIHGGRLQVGEAKTEAGLRDLELTAFCLDELRPHLAGLSRHLRDLRGAALPIFPTRTGGTLNPPNVRNRLLAETVKRANERRERDGRQLLPERVTPHALRRTFASLALAAGRDARWVMGQMGHTDARLTLSVYAQVVQRREVDEAAIWRLMRFPSEPETKGSGEPKRDRNRETSDTEGVE